MRTRNDVVQDQRRLATSSAIGGPEALQRRTDESQQLAAQSNDDQRRRVNGDPSASADRSNGRGLGIHAFRVDPKKILSPRLAASLKGVNVDSFVRVDDLRIQKALSTLDEVSALHSGSDAKSRRQRAQAESRYNSAFPDPNEREDWKLIEARLQDMKRLPNDPELRAKYGDSRYHVLVGSTEGEMRIGTQFSTIPIGDDRVAVYGQYSYVEEGYRRHGFASLMVGLKHSVAQADAVSMGRKGGVVGSIVECEYVGQGEDAETIRFTRDRMRYFKETGSKIMVLETADGRWLSPHLQPRLDAESQPIMLQMAFASARPTKPEDKEKVEQLDLSLARDLALSFVDNFEREGFDPKDVDEARSIVEERFAQAARVLLVPPDQIPDLIHFAKGDPALREQVERDLGPLEAQAAAIQAALAPRARVTAKIEPLDQQSLDAAIALAERTFPGESPRLGFAASLDPSAMAELIAARKRPPQDMRYWVARDPESDQVIGTIGLYQYPEDAATASWVGWFAVDAEHRSQGVGEQLLRFVTEQARSEGKEQLKLYTSDAPSERVAQSLYDKHAFYVVGSEPPETPGGPTTLYREKDLKRFGSTAR